MTKRLWTGRFPYLLTLALLCAAAVGCHSSGSECETCSSDQDCKAGLTCSTFSDGSRRCGSGVGATTCNTP